MISNSLFTFNGKATLFGTCRNSERCLDPGNADEVVQYDQELNEWVDLGRMRESRRLHAVVEVPARICDLLE